MNDGKPLPLIEPTGKLAELTRALGDAKRLLILTHNNPDPDAIAAAFGLRHILAHVHKVKTRLAFGGSVGRAENRAMVKLLRIPLHDITAGQVSRYKNVALVDSQPQAKNVLVPEGMLCRIVIDHHLAGRGRKNAEHGAFTDFRPEYGSTSTIIAEYARENEIPLNARVATALFYGIKTDIRDLGRDRTDRDIAMMQFVFPKISLKWLWKIENVQVPREYFRDFADAFNNAVITGDLVASDLGDVSWAEAVAEMADFLLRIKGVRWSFCVGRVGSRLVFSIRTLRKRKRVGELAYRLAGRKGSAGGHDRSAGGFIPLDDMEEKEIERVRKDLANRFAARIGRDLSLGTPLVEVPRADPEAEKAPGH